MLPWALLLLQLLTTYMLRSPFLLKVRVLASVAALALGLSLLGWVWPRLRAVWPRGAAGAQRARYGLRVFAALALWGTVWGPQQHLRAVWQRRQVLAAPTPLRARLAAHLVVGFRSWPEAEDLVSQALVGGVYVAKHNAQQLSQEQLTQHLYKLQQLRQQAGLPTLLITADQEGGPVSRLSPPLPLIPPLSQVIAGATTDAERDTAVRSFASEHAQALRSVGVNVNFGPVADLRLHPSRSFLDRYSFIGARAIAKEPALAASVAGVYAETLLQSGVIPTAKHFPGLGRVRTDTHFFPATLDTPLAELQEADWLPFRAVAQHAPSLLMLGHVYVTAVDRQQLASGSQRLVQGVIREQWGHQGVLITDDLCMAPVFHGPGGLTGFVVTALSAGVDLLLVSYDSGQVYPVLAALLRAYQAGHISEQTLLASDARLGQLQAFLDSAAAKP